MWHENNLGKQAFLVQAIAGIRGDIHSSPHTHWVAWQSTICYYPQRNGKRGFCFLYGKTLTSPNVWRCLSETRNPRQDDTFLLDFLEWGVGMGRQGDKWQEWEWSQVTCLHRFRGWTSSLWSSLFDSMIYRKISPSDAKDDITPYKEAIAYLDPTYLQTLLQRLPNEDILASFCFQKKFPMRPKNDHQCCFGPRMLIPMVQKVKNKTKKPTKTKPWTKLSSTLSSFLSSF